MIGRTVAILGSFVLTAGLLAGCAPGTPTISESASRGMETDIRSVAVAASAKDYAAASSRLKDLRAALTRAMRADQVTARKASSIQSFIDRVEADLAALRATPKPTPAPAVGSGSSTPPSSSTRPSSGGVVTPPPTRTTPTPTPTPTPTATPTASPSPSPSVTTPTGGATHKGKGKHKGK